MLLLAVLLAAVAAADTGPSIWITRPAAAPVFTEGLGAVALGGGMSLSDVSVVSGATAVVSPYFPGDVLQLNQSDPDVMMFIMSSFSDGTLTVSGTADVSIYERILRSLSFASVNKNVQESARNVTIVVRDELDRTSNTGSFTVTPRQVNDPPHLSQSETSDANISKALFVMDHGTGPAAGISALPSVVINDVDSASFLTATVELTGGNATLALAIDVADNAQVVASWDSAASALTLQAKPVSGVTSTALQAAMRSITFRTEDRPPTDLTGHEYTVRTAVCDTSGGCSAPLVSAVVVVTTPTVTGGMPDAMSVLDGEPIRLWVNATGTQPLTYAWFWNSSAAGITLLGTTATNEFSKPTALVALDDGVYFVQVSNAASSDAAPTTVPAPGGFNATRLAVTTTVPSWVSRARAALTPTVLAQTTDSGQRRVVLSWPQAPHTPADAPLLRYHVECAGHDGGFLDAGAAAAAAEAPAQDAEWRAIAGLLHDPALTIQIVATDFFVANSSYRFRITASNSHGNSTSAPTIAVVAEAEAPRVARGGDLWGSKRLDPGATVNLSLATAGYPPPSVQWFKDGQAQRQWQDNLTVVLADVTAAASGTYYAVLQNYLGAATSTTARLEVLTAPVLGEVSEGGTYGACSPGFQAGCVPPPALSCAVLSGADPAPDLRWQKMVVPPSAAAPAGVWATVARVLGSAGAGARVVHPFAEFTADEAGSYQCVANNSASGDAPAVSQVAVLALELCPSGRYTTGKGFCVDCEPGQYQAQVGMAQCEVCPKGKFQPSTAMGDCSGCASGRYAGVAALACENCPAGKFAAVAEIESGACKHCKAGRYRSTPKGDACAGCDSARAVLDTRNQSAADAAAVAAAEAGLRLLQNTTNQSALFVVAAEEGATHCILCPAGKFQVRAETHACHALAHTLTSSLAHALTPFLLRPPARPHYPLVRSAGRRVRHMRGLPRRPDHRLRWSGRLLSLPGQVFAEHGRRRAGEERALRMQRGLLSQQPGPKGGGRRPAGALRVRLVRPPADAKGDVQGCLRHGRVQGSAGQRGCRGEHRVDGAAGGQRLPGVRPAVRLAVVQPGLLAIQALVPLRQRKCASCRAQATLA
jgi:hypothetical protein